MRPLKNDHYYESESWAGNRIFKLCRTVDKKINKTLVVFLEDSFDEETDKLKPDLIEALEEFITTQKHSINIKGIQ